MLLFLGLLAQQILVKTTLCSYLNRSSLDSFICINELCKQHPHWTVTPPSRTCGTHQMIWLKTIWLKRQIGRNPEMVANPYFQLLVLYLCVLMLILLYNDESHKRLVLHLWEALLSAEKLQQQQQKTWILFFYLIIDISFLQNYLGWLNKYVCLC